jgi:hypothetical protein
MDSLNRQKGVTDVFVGKVQLPRVDTVPRPSSALPALNSRFFSFVPECNCQILVFFSIHIQYNKQNKENADNTKCKNRFCPLTPNE